MYQLSQILRQFKLKVIVQLMLTEFEYLEL